MPGGEGVEKRAREGAEAGHIVLARHLQGRLQIAIRHPELLHPCGAQPPTLPNAPAQLIWAVSHRNSRSHVPESTEEVEVLNRSE